MDREGVRARVTPALVPGVCGTNLDVGHRAPAKGARLRTMRSRIVSMRDSWTAVSGLASLVESETSLRPPAELLSAGTALVALCRFSCAIRQPASPRTAAQPT